MKSWDIKSKTLEELEDIITPIMLDSCNNDLTIKQACKRANVSYSFVKQVMQLGEENRKMINKEILIKIRKISEKIERLVRDTSE